jgi:hypothetical protein
MHPNEQNSNSVCRLKKWNTDSEAQKWIVEFTDSSDDAVAFKSVAGGKYLATLEPQKKNGGTIGVSETRQWFGYSKAKGPGWFHVKSVECSGGYLNDEWGRWNDDNRIQTYQFEVSVGLGMYWQVP